MPDSESRFGGEKPGESRDITEAYKTSSNLEELFDRISQVRPEDRLTLKLDSADVDFDIIPRLVTRFPNLEITIQADEEDQAMLSQMFPWANVRFETKE